MRDKAWLVIGLLGAACSKPADDPVTTAPSTKPAPSNTASIASSIGSANGSANGASASASTVAAKPPIDALPAIDVAAVCADSALLLVDVPLDQAAARYCAVCGPSDGNACGKKWPDDVIAPGAPAKERHDRMRNTVYAAYGYPFKKERWKKLFGALSWYRANTGFKEADLAAVATKNIALLGKTGAAPTSGIELELAPGSAGTFDVRGDGKAESITVEADGSKVTIGGLVIMSGDHLPKALAPADLPSIAGVAIIDLDRKKPGKQLALLYGWDEDESGWIVYDLAATTATFLGEVRPGVVPGDGTVIVTSGWCGVTTVTTYTGAKGFAKIGETKSGKHDNSKCAACPYVYVLSPAGRALQGEILRYQAGEGAYRLDALPIDAVAVDGVIHIELRELPNETTHLDSIHLEIDGQRVDPLECGSSFGGTPCATDRTFVTIAPTTTRVFSFRWSGPAPREVVLRATGYYVPG